MATCEHPANAGCLGVRVGIARGCMVANTRITRWSQQCAGWLTPGLGRVLGVCAFATTVHQAASGGDCARSVSEGISASLSHARDHPFAYASGTRDRLARRRCPSFLRLPCVRVTIPSLTLRARESADGFANAQPMAVNRIARACGWCLRAGIASGCMAANTRLTPGALNGASSVNAGHRVATGSARS
jgi:hypothetical protein